jgi:hypothetical protein
VRPLRDDDFGFGGVAQKLVFEALMLSDYVVADLTTPNPNVLYELGVRHAARPSGTLTLTARADELPFAVRSLRCVRYRLDDANGLSAPDAERLRQALTGELKRFRAEAQAGGPPVDSPVFQLVRGWNPARRGRVRAELFRPE